MSAQPPRPHIMHPMRPGGVKTPTANATGSAITANTFGRSDGDEDDSDGQDAPSGFPHYAAHRAAQDWVSPTDANAKAEAMDRYRTDFASLPPAHRQAWDDRAAGRDLQPGYVDPSNGAATARPVKVDEVAHDAPGKTDAAYARVTHGLYTGSLNGGVSRDRFAGQPTAAAESLAKAPDYVPSFPAGQSAAAAAPSQPSSTGFPASLRPRMTGDTTDTQGNRTVDYSNGGSVSIPAAQPQTPPQSKFAGGTGIFREGVEQSKGGDGVFRDAVLPASTATDSATADPDQPRAATDPAGWLDSFQKKRQTTALA